MALQLSPAKTDNLQLLPEYSGGVLRVLMKGNADSASNDAFASFITRVHTEAQRLGVNEVQLDLRELYFMTSSCIKCFVTWIGFIKNTPIDKQYKINFLVNANLRWQKRNLDVLLQLSSLLSLKES